MIFGNIWYVSYFYGINPAQSENPVFYILMFQGPKQRPNDLQFWEHLYLEGRRPGSEGSKQTEVLGPKGGGPRGHSTWPRGAHSFGPRGSVAVDLSSRRFPVT